MKLNLALLTLLLFCVSAVASAQQKPQQRCGWFENPTPANAWLTDKDGTWIISTQGAGGAEGDWPSFSPSRWLKTNGSYGYGCACMKIEANKAEMSVSKILSATSRPLSTCRRDPAIRKKEPKL